MRKSEKGLSVAYGKVVNGYRTCGERDIISPSEFKAHMGRRKDRFAGSAQQDSQ